MAGNSMDDAYLQKLLEKLKGTSTGASLLEYLTQRGQVPGIKMEQPFYGAVGDFSYDGISDPGRIRLGEQAGLGTLVHELTHAAEKSMVGQYYKGVDKSSRDESYVDNPQFMDAYEKLWHGGSYYRNKGKNYGPDYLPNKFGKEWTFEERDYRSSPRELNAHAVGNQYSHWPDRAPQHLDPTLATEFEIMLELAKRRKPKQK
jgi:hypothetical protein